MQPRLRALFFDFDGVIVDSVQTKTEAFRLLFSEYPADVIEKVLDHHKQHGGISRVDKIAHAHECFIGTPLSTNDLNKWAQRYSDLVLENVIEADWIPGAREFLQKAGESELKIFVISGTPEQELRYIIEKKGIGDIFHEQLGSPTKKPEHIRFLLDKYGLLSSECVFIGDAFTDYFAAKETGLTFIGIQGDIEFPEGTTVLPNCTELQAALNTIFLKNT